MWAISKNNDKMSVQGSSTAVTVARSWDDHRIVMSLAVAGMVAGATEIDTAESVAVSYPGYAANRGGDEGSRVTAHR